MKAWRGLVVASVLVPARASAQTTPPPASFLAPSSTGDHGGDAGSFSGWTLSSPLRLSLQGSIAPMAHMFPQCQTLEDDAGNSVGGIPVQHYAELRLAPRLVLSVFSQLGCPIDAGLGGGLTYEVPLRASMSLVFGAGLYGAPGQAPLFGGWGAAFLKGLRGQPSAFSAAARTDLIWKTPSGLPLGVGVQTRGRVHQLTFSGGF